MPQNFEDETLGRWKTADGAPAEAVAIGNVLDGLRKLVHVEEKPEKPAREPREPQPEAPKPDPQPEEEREPEAPEEQPDEREPESEEDERERKAMSKQQRERFDNLAKRIFAKAEASFGGTKESVEVGPNLPGGVFDGDEVARVLEIKSRGITYRITLSAERFE
jgi:outer membrane biosynthesis protein TonB